jgi:hypothetical protein
MFEALAELSEAIAEKKNREGASEVANEVR